ncbi:hypothetical protein ASE00_09355 [Sphingomonas sp. Root710]|nr:hypothetical protein ASE00_09355 [Sphingomonas sp. Root710]
MGSQIALCGFYTSQIGYIDRNRANGSIVKRDIASIADQVYKWLLRNMPNGKFVEDIRILSR